MKNKYLSSITQGATFGIGLLGIMFVGGLVYAAGTWVSQSTVTTGEALTASTWNEMVSNMNYLNDSKLSTSGASGTLNMGSNKITGLDTPTANSDAATKAYVDSVAASGGGANNYAMCTTNYSVSGSVGIAAMNSLCASQCGGTFATLEDFFGMKSFIFYHRYGNHSWIGGSQMNCSNWTSTSGQGKVLQAIVEGRAIFVNYSCSGSRLVLCKVPFSDL